MEDSIIELLQAIVCRLVTKSDKVKIEKDDNLLHDEIVVYKVTVDEEDMGRIIGRHGRIAKSIRSIARAAAVRQNLKIAVEIG